MHAASRVFGERLKEWRRASGLTLVQLSERSGITADYISKIEGGGANPTLDTMVSLAGTVGAEVWDLVRSSPQSV